MTWSCSVDDSCNDNLSCKENTSKAMEIISSHISSSKGNSSNSKSNEAMFLSEGGLLSVPHCCRLTIEHETSLWNFHKTYPACKWLTSVSYSDAHINGLFNNKICQANLHAIPQLSNVCCRHGFDQFARGRCERCEQLFTLIPAWISNYIHFKG